MSGDGWFKPEYQPRPDAPLEFKIKPLDLQTAYETQASLSPRGAIAWAMIAKIFSQFVTEWRGLEVRCDLAARLEVLSGSGKVHGVEGRDWIVYLAAIAQRAYTDSMLSEDERKN